MNDTISRQAAINELETVGYDFSNSELSETELAEVCEAVGNIRQDMINRISRMPSAQPEIVRCKDCKYSELYINEYDDHCYWCSVIKQKWSRWMAANDYCSYAAKREE